MRTPIRTWKSNLILDKEHSDQGLFGKLIINNQIGLVKVKKINWKFPFTTLVHLALIHVATLAKTLSLKLTALHMLYLDKVKT